MKTWTGRLMAMSHQFWMIGDDDADLTSLDYSNLSALILSSPDLAAFISPADTDYVGVTIRLHDSPDETSGDLVDSKTWVEVVTFTEPARLRLANGMFPDDPDLASLTVPAGRYTIRARVSSDGQDVDVTTTDSAGLDVQHKIDLHPAR